MRLANFNIRANPPMRRRRVRADLRVAHDTRARVLCWQELAKLPWYRSILKQVFPAREGWVHLHLKHRNATSVDTEVFRIVRTRQHRLTGGNPLLPQPARWTNETVIQSLIFDEYLVAVLNSHFDNGGYNGRWRPGWNRRARQKRWDRQFGKTQRLVHRLHEEGLDVVGSGDYNRERMPKFHPDQVWLLENGIMKMWVVPAAGARTRSIDPVTIAERALFTDHPGMVVTVRRAP